MYARESKVVLIGVVWMAFGGQFNVHRTSAKRTMVLD